MVSTEQEGKVSSKMDTKNLKYVSKQNVDLRKTSPLDMKTSITTYGIVLHGTLKTRFVKVNNNRKSLFDLQSRWKLRYWRLVLTDEGLLLEKSRRANMKPYKSILLPFGKTSVWENWGIRGDCRHSFGFTLRVSCSNFQMEAALDLEKTRRRWMNVLQCAFCTVVVDTTELVNYLAQKASDRLSKMTNADDEHCAIRLRADKEKKKLKSVINCSDDDCNNRLYCEAIPRRYNANLYDSTGHMSDQQPNSSHYIFYSNDCTQEPSLKSEDIEVTTSDSLTNNNLISVRETNFLFDSPTPTCPLIIDKSEKSPSMGKDSCKEGDTLDHSPRSFDSQNIQSE